MKRTLSRLILIAPWTLAVGACGSSQGNGEAPGSSSQAYSYATQETIAQSTFNDFVAMVHPEQATISVSNNVATFTPSPAMQNWLGMKPLPFTIGTQTVGGGGCNYTSNVTSLSFGSPLAITLTGSEIDLTATLDASVNFTHVGFSVYCPNSFQINISNAPMLASIVSSNGNLGVGTANVTVPGYLSGTCGAFNWCGGIVTSYADAAAAAQSGQLTGIASGYITPAFQQSFFNGLVTLESLSLPAGASSAFIAAGSFSIANSALNFTLDYSDAPPALTCTATANCTGNSPDETITVQCTSPSANEDFTAQFQQLVNGAWQNVGTSSAWSGLSWSTTVPTNGSEQTLTYQVLSQDGAGSSTSNTVTVVMNSSCCYSTSEACGSSCGPVSRPNGCGGTINCDQGCSGDQVCGANNECGCRSACPSGEVQNPVTCTCATKKCTTPQQCCIDAGGYWKGKQCE
jgi:hypothetical protein